MGRDELQAMANRWEQLARRNPHHFIATSKKHWSDGEFYASGQAHVDHIMHWIDGELAASRRQRMLEIGCGLGRLTAAFARYFERADGVDISAAMIEQARSANLPANVSLNVVAGDSLDLFADRSFDLVYCGLVFQHIPDAAVIQSYLREIARVLQPHGVGVVQFDTRDESLLLRAYKALPDALLPPRHRRYIRRYRRAAGQVQRWMTDAGLRNAAEQNPGSAEHFFLLRRDQPAGTRA